MKRTISVLVEKDAGGLVRIISLLTRRRFQIESITMAACERKCYCLLYTSPSPRDRG